MASLQMSMRDIFKFSFSKNRTDFFVAIGVVSVVIMLLVPLPGPVLDFLLTINLMISLLTILLSLYVKEPVQFSIFPTLLLVTAVFGLALNVSSTRLILSLGQTFNSQIIRAFGQFVVGRSGTEGTIIGIIIFAIIMVVQLMVITKGATRVSEVAARFALDSMQMKQMSIDSEFNQGIITEEQMHFKKKLLQHEMDFYGAMDGATKFVSGNVMAGIIITLINIAAGLAIGMGVRGESASSAWNTYVTLTIGDGLVSQLPALLVSVSTGLLVTRSVGGESSFGAEAKRQFGQQARIYWIAGAFLCSLAFLPGFPTGIMLPTGALTLFLAYALSRRDYVQMKHDENESAKIELERKNPEIAPVVPLDTISMELGYGLIPLVDKDQGAELLERITRIRREAALDLGLVVSPIRIVDNMRLEPTEYSLKIKGVEVGQGRLRLDEYMAINPGGEREPIEGDPTQDPAFNLPALWITDEQRDRAERLGYTVVDSPSIVATHLTEVIKNHAAELLGRQETQKMLDELRKTHPAVVEECFKHFSVGEIQKVLQALLHEQVSVRNIVTILETLGDFASITKETGFLVEKCRQALGRQITRQYTDEDGILRVLTIEPSLEQMLIDSRQDTTSGPISSLAPDKHRAWMNALLNTVQIVQGEGYYPVVLCSEPARPLVKNSCLRDLPQLAVLSILEISQDAQVESLGEIRLNQHQAAAKS